MSLSGFEVVLNGFGGFEWAEYVVADFDLVLSVPSPSGLVWRCLLMVPPARGAWCSLILTMLSDFEVVLNGLGVVLSELSTSRLIVRWF